MGIFFGGILSVFLGAIPVVFLLFLVRVFKWIFKRSKIFGIVCAISIVAFSLLAFLLVSAFQVRFLLFLLGGAIIYGITLMGLFILLIRKILSWKRKDLKFFTLAIIVGSPFLLGFHTFRSIANQNTRVLLANESNQEISFLLRTEGSIVGIMDDEKKVTLPSRTEKITSVYFDRMNPGSGELNLVPLRGESRRFYWTLHPDEFRRPYLNLIFILDDFIWDIRSMPLNRNITFSDYTDGLIKIHRH